MNNGPGRRIARAVLCTFLLNTLHSVTFADIGDWKTFTNAKQVRELVLTDSGIWCASGGGVLEFDRGTESFHLYTNTEGLAGNDFISVSVDPRGRVWTAMADGHINLFQPGTQRWETVSDYFGQNLELKQVLAYGDSLYVATSIGISLYDSRRREVKETYRIGDVRRVLISGGEIWAVLDQNQGLLRASLSFPNLMAPSAWQSYNRFDGLPDETLYSISALGDSIAVGTRSGIGFFHNGSWSDPELSDKEILALSSRDGELVAATNHGVYLRSRSAAWSRLEPLIRGINSVAAGDGEIWCGTSSEGLVRHDPDNLAWISHAPNGPGDNRFSALLFDRSGVLWTASSSGAISRFDGESWRVFSIEGGELSSADYRDLLVDDQNRVWAASWGGGVAVFETRDDGEISIREIKTEGGRLSGISNDPNFVVVTALARDENGNIWMTNYNADDFRALAVVDSTDRWNHFSTLDGLNSILVTALGIDRLDRKWIGSMDRGITVVDDAATPFDPNDDDLTLFFTTEDGLENNHIRSLTPDLDGLMWIGTPEGLNYAVYEPDPLRGGNEYRIYSRYNVINDNINCVDVDVRNNKWIGTAGGMSILGADGFTWTHYSTSNSALVSDNVTCFAFNDRNGQVYIGTTNGLSRLETAFTRPASNLANIRGYPNPFVLDGPETRFYIDNLTENVSVRFYTPDGFLVKHIPETEIVGSRISWDGTNDRGDRVASGVYVFLATDREGRSNTGKVAVIRP